MLNNLTPRELQLVRLIVLGYSNSQIADSLCIAFSTAKAHVESILKKFGVKNRVRAASIGVCLLKVKLEEIIEASKTFDSADED